MHKNYFLLVLFLMAVGCSAPKLNVMTTTGAALPNPHYFVSSTSETSIRAVFYYVGLVVIKDVDHSSQYTPVYLDRNTKYIKSGKFQELQLVLQVYNPNKTTYMVQTLKRVKTSNYKPPIDTHGLVAVSKLNYREYVFRLPIEGEDNISYNVALLSEDGKETYMSTGKFTYQIN